MASPRPLSAALTVVPNQQHVTNRMRWQPIDNDQLSLLLTVAHGDLEQRRRQTKTQCFAWRAASCIRRHHSSVSSYLLVLEDVVFVCNQQTDSRNLDDKDSL